ncbi:transposase [Streptomyces sp. NPDC002676]
MLLPRYRYPSATSDLEWALLERLLPTPACQTPKGGAPEKWPRRRAVDAIRYIVGNGAKWRALPADVQERAAARVLLTRLHAEHPGIGLPWADNAYGGDEFASSCCPRGG